MASAWTPAPLFVERGLGLLRSLASLKGSDFPVANFLGWLPCRLCFGQYHLPTGLSRRDVLPSHSAWLAYYYSLLALYEGWGRSKGVASLQENRAAQDLGLYHM